MNMSQTRVMFTIPKEILKKIDSRNNGIVSRSKSLQKVIYQIVASEQTFDQFFPQREGLYQSYYEKNIKPKLLEESKKTETPPESPKKEYLVSSSENEVSVSSISV